MSNYTYNTAEAYDTAIGAIAQTGNQDEIKRLADEKAAFLADQAAQKQQQIEDDAAAEAEEANIQTKLAAAQRKKDAAHAEEVYSSGFARYDDEAALAEAGKKQDKLVADTGGALGDKVQQAEAKKQQEDAEARQKEIDAELDSILRGADDSKDAVDLDKLQLNAKSSAHNLAQDPEMGVPDYLKDLTKDDNYIENMYKMNKELLDKEEALNKDLRDRRARARLQSVVLSAINSAATMYAASQGVKTQLSQPLDFQTKERLQDAKDEIDDERRLLRTRINNSKTLMREAYSLESDQESKAAKKEAKEDIASIKKQDKKDAQAEKDRLRDAEKQRLNQQDLDKYEASVTKTTDNLLKQVASQPKSKQIKLLMSYGIKEDRAKELAGKDTGWFWFDEDPDLEGIRAAMKVVAERQTAMPIERPLSSSELPETTTSEKAVATTPTSKYKVGTRAKTADGTPIEWNGTKWVFVK